MNKKITALCMLFLILSFAASAASKKFVLVIDPGHGGKDAGALGAFSKEKDINLSVAMAFGRQVQRNCHDVKVIYTRTTDVFIGLKERAEIANKNKADLFISVHTNALPGGKQAYGMETYTLGMHRAGDNLDVAKRENAVILIEKDYKQSYQGFNPNSSESYIMFEFMQDRNMANSVDLAKMVQRETCASASRPDKGVHQAGFLVLRETSMPGSLIELGFITTPDEERLLNDKAKVENIAAGIYRAFVNYKNKYHNNIVVPYKPSAVPGTVTPPVVPDDYKTDEPASPAKTTIATPRRNEKPVTETPRNEQTNTTVATSRTQTTNQNTEEGKLVPIGMIVGNYDDYDQVTINFAGTNTPEWTAEYIDNPTQQGSGRPIKYDGDHALNLYIKNVAMPFEVGRDDPNLSPVPGIGPAVSEVRSGGTFEGQAQFVIGLKDSKHPYKVHTEQNPTRLIIDVQH